MKKPIFLSILLLSLVASQSAAQSKDKDFFGMVFDHQSGAEVQVACNKQPQKCFLKATKLNKNFDSQVTELQYSSLGQASHEVHLNSVPDSERQFTLYFTDNGTAREITFWKDESGKRFNLKWNEKKSDSFDPKKFYKASLK